ncbi:nectin 1a isoform X2 [Misgurnus anguillicaudatus]|uniref:nectin 1a isoform X2 n=1 Tax=Misgurnus anguillicaudatus TaxID=75329 RepID=UPI003CCF80E4
MDLLSKFIPLLLSYTTLLTVLQGQRVDIVSEIIAYQSHDVTLPCRFVHGRTEEKLTQVGWTWRNPFNKNVSLQVILFDREHGIHITNNTVLKDRVKFSTNPNLTFEASIIIKHVKLTDQGVYSCAYTTHPSGSRTEVTTLKVQEDKPPLLSTAATARIVTVILITVILTSVGYLFLNKRRRAASTSVNYITQSPDDLQQGEITYADVTV